MRAFAYVLPLLLTTAGLAAAGPASGAVKSQTGTISPKHAIAYVVRDGRNARNMRVEVLLTDVPIDSARCAATSTRTPRPSTSSRCAIATTCCCGWRPMAR